MIKQVTKIIFIFSIIGNIILLGSIFLTSQEDSKKNVVLAQTKTMHVTAISLSQSPILDAEIDGFKEQLTKDGIPFVFTAYFANGDPLALKSFAENAAHDEQCDVIFSCGIFATRALKGIYEKKNIKKPTFYTNVSEEVVVEIEESERNCSAHMTGSYIGNHWDDTFDLVLKLFPHIKSALLPLGDIEGGDERLNLVREALEKRNITLTPVCMRSLSDLKLLVRPLISSYDLILNLRTPLLIESTPLLVKEVLSCKSIFFSTEKDSIEDGLQCSKSFENGAFGRIAGELAAQYWKDGVPIKNIAPINVLNKASTLYLNKKTLDHQGISIDPRLEFLMTKSTVVRA